MLEFKNTAGNAGVNYSKMIVDTFAGTGLLFKLIVPGSGVDISVVMDEETVGHLSKSLQT